jgi:LEA14-like dessication related protein
MFFQKKECSSYGRLPLHIFSVLLVVLLSGCSVFQKSLDVSKPKASINGVTIDKLSTQSVTLLVDVKVTNPNTFVLKTAGFDLGLLINNQRIASVVQPDASLSLPAKGSNNIQLPVTLTFDQIMKSVSDFGDKTEISYGVEGKVAVDVPVLGNINMPVSFSGVLPIPKQPEITFKNFNVDKISLSGAKLSVDLDIKNPNVFDIDLNNVNYQFGAQGKPLGIGEIKAINLPQGKTQSISIPLSIGMSDMGMSLYRILSSSDPIAVDISMGAEVDAGIDGWKSSPLSLETQQMITR